MASLLHIDADLGRAYYKDRYRERVLATLDKRATKVGGNWSPLIAPSENTIASIP